MLSKSSRPTLPHCAICRLTWRLCCLRTCSEPCATPTSQLSSTSRLPGGIMRRQRTHFAHSACHSSKYDGVSLRRRGQRTCLCAIGGSFQTERPKPGFVPTAAAVVRVQPAATLSSTSQYPPCAQCCTDTERSTLHIRHAGIENAIMSTQSRIGESRETGARRIRLCDTLAEMPLLCFRFRSFRHE